MRLHMTTPTFSRASYCPTLCMIWPSMYLQFVHHCSCPSAVPMQHFPIWTDCMKVKMPIKDKHETKQWDHTDAVDLTQE